MTRTIPALLAACISASSALAWDAVGHRAITWLALDNLPPDAPEFLRLPDIRDGVAWQAAEPDRWRGVSSPILRHENAPDHYIDVEDLAAFGLTLETINPLRYRFVRDVALARQAHPAGPDGTYQPYNAKLDTAGDKEWPGLVLHAIAEHHAKLLSQFKTYRTLIALNDPARAPQLAQTKANITSTMGILAHFVGDMAQPLHTTKHFNGWVGDNPNGYTTEKTFHAYIDGGVLFLHGLNYHTLRPTQTFTTTINPASAWEPTLTYLKRTHALVEPLYKMEKDGTLDQEPGKEFITARLNDAADMLAAYYASAWAGSVITPKDIEDFQRYDGFSPAQRPAADASEREKANTPSATIGELIPGQRVLLAGIIEPDGKKSWTLKLANKQLAVPSWNGHRALKGGASIIAQGHIADRSESGQGQGMVLVLESWKPAGK